MTPKQRVLNLLRPHPIAMTLGGDSGRQGSPSRHCSKALAQWHPSQASIFRSGAVVVLHLLKTFAIADWEEIWPLERLLSSSRRERERERESVLTHCMAGRHRAGGATSAPHLDPPRRRLATSHQQEQGALGAQQG